MRSTIRRKWLLWIVIPLASLLVLALSGVLIIYFYQHTLVQKAIAETNETLEGTLTLQSSRIAPFQNFPYISIDLQGLALYETKDTTLSPILFLKDAYVGFRLWDVLRGSFSIKKVKLTEGDVQVIHYADNTYNLLRALHTDTDIDTTQKAPMAIDLQAVELSQIRLRKVDEADSLQLDLLTEKAAISFKQDAGIMHLKLNAQCILNILSGGDSTFVRNKHVGLSTIFDFNEQDHLIQFADTEVQLENARFGMQGSIDFDDDMRLDLSFTGKKPNFDLLIAFVPNELADALRRYGNRGDIFFESKVAGKCINGFIPEVSARFGCRQGFFSNLANERKLDELAFTAYYTNGKDRTLSSSEFRLTDFSARPEAGIFKGNLVVKNFISPEIDMQVQADFDLDFLTRFFNLDKLKDLTGKVELAMNFHDIVDLAQPERTLEKLNQAYFSELTITNLQFKPENFAYPVEQLNVKARSQGNSLVLEQLKGTVASSDISLQGRVSNLPALVHQSTQPVHIQLQAASSRIDVGQLLQDQQAIDEVLSNVKMSLSYQGTAANLLGSQSTLPTGNYEVTGLQASFKNYPQSIAQGTLKAGVKGNMLDVQQLSARLGRYYISASANLTGLDLLLSDAKKGTASIAYKLNVPMMNMGNVFRYAGASLLPPAMQQAELSSFAMQGGATLNFEKDSLTTAGLYVNNLGGKINHYPHAFHHINLKARWQQNTLYVDQLDGMVDQSDVHFKGSVDNLSLWMAEDKQGDSKFTFDFWANSLRLQDLFTYNGVHYVPEDYRHEVLSALRGKGSFILHFKNDSLVSKDLYIDQLSGKALVHAMPLEKCSGNIHFENQSVNIRNLKATLGRSDVQLDGVYHLEKDADYRRRGDKLVLRSTYLDLDELMAWEMPPTDTSTVDHDAAFNVFALPFRNLQAELHIGGLNYHKYSIKALDATLRLQENHYLYVDNAQLQAAGGSMLLKGYFNGSDSNRIYFSPDMRISKMNISEVMYKLDNFGQDVMVSDNLQGIFTGRIRGKVLMHKDLTPRIDDSDLQIEVSVEKGRLERFEPMYAMADFFGDKNLQRIVFDKLENRLVLRNGVLVLPNMVINSSLGYIQLSGKQGIDLTMEYYMRIPLRLVTRAAMGKLFGRRAATIDPEQEDEIIYKDPERRTSYINVKITGTPDDYKISLQKNKALRRNGNKAGDDITAFEDLDEEL